MDVRNVLLLSCATGALMGSEAYAQSPEIAEVVVTAQRREQSLTEVPVSVQAISSGQLEDARVESVQDLRRIAPSLQFSNGFGPGTSGLVIRGVSSRQIGGIQQASAAVVFDGVPLVAQGEFATDLQDIDRVEVLRGPQGTLFGKNATAGVLNVVTRAPVEEFQASVGVGYTTDDAVTTNAMLNVGSGTTWARITGFWRDQGPLFRNIHPINADLGASEQWGVQGKLRVEITPELRWLGTASHQQGQDSFGQFTPTRPASGALGPRQTALNGYTPTLGSTVVNTNAPSYNNYSGSALISELTWDATPDLTITALTGWRRYELIGIRDTDSTPVGINVGYGITDTYGAQSYLPNASTGRFPEYQGSIFYGQDAAPVNTYDYWSQELRANFSNERFDVVAGAFYQAVDVENRSRGSFQQYQAVAHSLSAAGGCWDGVGPAPAGLYCLVPTGLGFVGDSKLEDDTWAVFADVNVKWTTQWSTFVGLRYTSEEMSYTRDGARYFDSGIPGSANRYLAVNGPAGTDDFDEISGTLFPGRRATPLVQRGTRDDTNLSGRAGIQWQPTPSQNYYLSYSRAYKGPAVDPERTSALLGIVDFIRPETGIAWEFGIKQRLFDNRVTLNVAIFDQEIQDVQVSTTLPAQVGSVLLNAGSLELRGVEADFRAAVTNNITIDGGLVYLDGEHKGGENSCYDVSSAAAPPPCFDSAGLVAGPGAGADNRISLTGLRPQTTSRWRYNVGFNYERKVDAGSINARIGYAWQSAQAGAINGDPLLAVPSYGTLDASVRFSAESGRWDLTVFGQNLTDELIISTTAATGPIARTYNFYPRDFHRYACIRLNVRY